MSNKRSTDNKRTVKELKDNITNRYGTIEKHPGNINPIFTRKPYSEVGKKVSYE